MTRSRPAVRLFGALLGLGLLAAPRDADAALVLTPGTVIGFDGDTDQLREYDFSGNLMDTLTVTGLPDTPTGVAVLGGRLFVGDVSGNVGEVDLVTGAVFGLFNGGGDQALGDNGTNLLTYNFGGVVREYTPGGSLVRATALAGGSGGTGSGGTGIDGQGGRIFLGQWGGNGNVREFDAAGALVNTVVTGLPGNSVSGLGYDPTNGTFWVSTGFGDDRIRQFSGTGALLADFAAGSPFINGLEVIPAGGPAAVPEPSSLALGGTAMLLGLAGRRLRRPAA